MADVLQAKLDLLAEYGAYEYDAGEEGLDECARLFRELASADRADVDHLIEVLTRMQTRGRFAPSAHELGSHPTHD